MTLCAASHSPQPAVRPSSAPLSYTPDSVGIALGVSGTELGVGQGKPGGLEAATRAGSGGGGMSGGGGDSGQTPSKFDHGPQQHVRTREEVLSALKKELGPCVQGLCR